jgi:RNA polymerase sigma-70 factor (ECF subfamily)
MQKTTAEDGATISRFQDGDKAAFNDLVARHRQRAYHYASRLTNNPDEAADIVAETFLRAYRSLDGFKGDSSFSTWLYRIETNCFLDMRKRANCRASVSLDDELQVNDGRLPIQIVDECESAQERVEKGERLTAIESAMKHLPDHQRAILVMYHAQSMSYEDIADALRLPIGTVKSRLNRARLSLRVLLRPCRNLFIARKARAHTFTLATQ